MSRRRVLQLVEAFNRLWLPWKIERAGWWTRSNRMKFSTQRRLEVVVRGPRWDRHVIPLSRWRRIPYSVAHPGHNVLPFQQPRAKVPEYEREAQIVAALELYDFDGDLEAFQHRIGLPPDDDAVQRVRDAV